MLIRDKFLEMYMNFAYEVSNRSYCQRKRVGAILADNRRIVAYGYNGTAPGEENCCEVGDEHGNEITGPNVIHAEENCLINMANSPDIAENFSMFITCSPCFFCAGKILTARVREVYFDEIYRSEDGILRLLDQGVPVYKRCMTHDVPFYKRVHVNGKRELYYGSIL